MRYGSRVILLASLATAAACAASTEPATSGRAVGGALLVESVVPAGGTVGVDPNAPITVVFNHPMMLGMEELVMLHTGSVTGPSVAGSATWSSDRTRLTFTPAAPLAPHTTYVLHLSPNLKDRDGSSLDWATCARTVGGTAATPAMFGGGMMSGGMGPGMMGSGWQAGSGAWSYGMLLTFTTA